jgi:hypothetical protein
VRLATLRDCRLAIGAYPPFRYDARAGGGNGHLDAASPSEPQGRQQLRFEPDTLTIPPLDWRSTRLFALPLPPGVTIRIVPRELAGSLDPRSGAIDLRFRARFHCTIRGLIRAAPLIVETCLTTGRSAGSRHAATGSALDATGRAVLVGVARVPASGQGWLDRFLGLPDEALAVLRCRLEPAA